MRRNYIFTDKSYSEVSILSFLLGILSVACELYALEKSFLNEGAPDERLGMAVFLCFLFSLAGTFLGIWSRLEKDRFYLFSNLGIILNVLGLAGAGVILFLSMG